MVGFSREGFYRVPCVVGFCLDEAIISFSDEVESFLYFPFAFLGWQFVGSIQGLLNYEVASYVSISL